MGDISLESKSSKILFKQRKFLKNKKSSNLSADKPMEIDNINE